MRLTGLIFFLMLTAFNVNADMIGVSLDQEVSEEEKTFLVELYPEFSVLLAKHPEKARRVARKVIAIHAYRSGSEANVSVQRPTGRATDVSPEASLDLVAIMKQAVQKLQQ